MPNAALLVVYLLAVARIVRLVTSDRLTEGPRDRVIHRLWRRHWTPAARIAVSNGSCSPSVDSCARLYADRAMADRADPPLLIYMLTCPWCVSVYVGAVAAPLIWLWGSTPWLAVPALALALSHGVGIIATKGE